MLPLMYLRPCLEVGLVPRFLIFPSTAMGQITYIAFTVPIYVGLVCQKTSFTVILTWSKPLMYPKPDGTKTQHQQVSFDNSRRDLVPKLEPVSAAPKLLVPDWGLLLTNSHSNFSNQVQQ